MPGWETRSRTVDAAPVAEAGPLHSEETLKLIQDAYGGIDAASAGNAATILLECPVGEGQGPMSLGDLIQNKNHDPKIARVGKKVLERIKDEAQDDPGLQPEDILIAAFGKRSVIRDPQTGEIARQTLSLIPAAEAPKGSKKKWPLFGGWR